MLHTCIRADTTVHILLPDMRRTDENGNTVWQESLLLQAIIRGSTAVLDGIHRLSSDALSVLASVIRDR